VAVADPQTPLVLTLLGSSVLGAFVGSIVAQVGAQIIAGRENARQRKVTRRHFLTLLRHAGVRFRMIAKSGNDGPNLERASAAADALDDAIHSRELADALTDRETWVANYVNESVGGATAFLSSRPDTGRLKEGAAAIAQTVTEAENALGVTRLRADEAARIFTPILNLDDTRHSSPSPTPPSASAPSG
jgi:hypothetical protein